MDHLIKDSATLELYAWLDPDAAADPALLAPPDRRLADAIDIREVSPLVNRVANNGPELLEPLDFESDVGQYPCDFFGRKTGVEIAFKPVIRNIHN